VGIRKGYLENPKHPFNLVGHCGDFGDFLFFYGYSLGLKIREFAKENSLKKYIL
jgi:hypothetical protein